MLVAQLVKKFPASLRNPTINYHARDSPPLGPYFGPDESNPHAPTLVHARLGLPRNITITYAEKKQICAWQYRFIDTDHAISRDS
jgi:hypothetical protein